MSELRHRRGEGDGNDKMETAGESDHVNVYKNFVIYLLEPVFLWVDVILRGWLLGGFGRGEEHRREICGWNGKESTAGDRQEAWTPWLGTFWSIYKVIFQ